MNYPNVSKIRDSIAKHRGKVLKMKVFEPRNVVLEYEGVLAGAYPSCFVVDIDLEKKPKSADRVSFNYADILTGDVEIYFV